MQELESPSKRFENLVKRVLTENGFEVSSFAKPLSIGGFDFKAEWQNASWAIEVKYYRTARAQLSLVESAAARLVHRADSEQARLPLLIISSELTQDLKSALEAKYELALIDRSALYNLAQDSSQLISELEALLEIKPTDTSAQNEDGGTSRFKRRDVRRPLKVEPDTKGSELCGRLKKLAPGVKTYKAHENLCVEIIKYLFDDALLGFREQQKTNDKMSRFDLVCRMAPGKDFWNFLISHLNSRYVIFEFKNYTEKIKQGQILTTEKYLLEKALRRAAIVITRKGADDNAIFTTHGAMREHGKLILVLDDDKVCTMLHMKERGEDPTDALFEWADDFMLSLPR